jgi:hypothetical protein
MTDSSEHFVADAIGPPLPVREAVAALSLGVVSLLMAGVIPALLGALAAEGRLSAAGIGQSATLEGLSMGIFTGLAGVLLKPERLRWIAAASALVLVALEIATTRVSGGGILLVRAAAGLPEGLLLWVSIGMIARTELPERWAAIFLTAVTIAQFAFAVPLNTYVLPRFGATGGFIALGVATLPAFVFALFVPVRYAALVMPQGESGVPPLRGWAALVATLVFIAPFAAVSVYLQPLAREAGLDANVARLALTLSLLAQVIGGVFATAVAGRVHYMVMFAAGTACFLFDWTVMGLHAPAWAFIGVNAMGGFAYMVVTPFLVPMTIEADPSRRAAVMSAGAQVLAGATGPFAASFLVSNADVHGALYLGEAMLLTGLLMMAGMHVVALRERAHRQLIVTDAAE